MKKHHQLLAATFAVAMASFAYSAPPSDVLSPADKAMAKVRGEIYGKISPPAQPFSRVAPTSLHTLEWKPQILVRNEPYLPFVIREKTFLGSRTASDAFKGYVRLGTQEIYLHDPEKDEYLPASEHPRFAPAKIRVARPSTPG